MNTNYIKKLRERLSNSIGLPFQNILTEKMIIKALNDENIKYRKRLYDPIITLWTFICQVLDDDKSCRKAISRTNALMANDENKLPSADTGAIIDAVIDSFTKQEITLFRLLYPHLSSGDIALGDRAFGSYADICLILQRGVDSVFRMHASRKVDFSKGKSLGYNDHIVYWNRPKAGNLSLEPELYEQLPNRIALREIRFSIHIKGYRTQVVTLVTTLLDHETYTHQDLAQLYGYRWQVEIDLRHLKTTMKMEFIHSKSPSMVEKEFYVHLLAYNLIRVVLWDAGIRHHISPSRLSFRGAIQYIHSFMPILSISEARNVIYAKMLSLIAQEKLPDRPFRVEPRMVKRRPKAFPYLRCPRQEIRQKLVA